MPSTWKHLTLNAFLWAACMLFALALFIGSKLAFGEEKAVHPIAAAPASVKSSEVSFKAASDGPGGIGTVGMEGKGCKLSADLSSVGAKLSGKITVDLLSCSMGEEKRDGHMKEDFGKAGAKDAVCEIKDLPMKGEGAAKCEMMTIGKVASEQPFSYKWNGNSLEAKIDMKLSTYNIPRRTFLNATVHDPVTVTAKLGF